MILFTLIGCSNDLDKTLKCNGEYSVCPDGSFAYRNSSLNCNFNTCTQNLHEESLPEKEKTINISEIKFIFSSQRCDDSINIKDDSKIGLKKLRWDNKRLIIEAYVSLNCLDEVRNGSYELINNTIILYYTKNKCKDCGKCTCVHPLRYELSDIPVNNYNFELRYEETLTISKELDKNQAYLELRHVGCWYDLNPEDECIYLDGNRWVMRKEGCSGSCFLDMTSNKAYLDVKTECNALKKSCKNDEDCKGIDTVCASGYTCSNQYCTPVFNRECFEPKDCVDKDKCKYESGCECVIGRCRFNTTYNFKSG